MNFSITIDLGLKPIAQRIDTLGSDAVQTTGKFIRPLAEFSTRVEVGQREFNGGHAAVLVEIHRDAASIIAHRAGAIAVNVDEDIFSIPRHVFVDGIVHHFKDAMVQALLIRVSDVHSRPVAHGLGEFQLADLIGVILLTGIHPGIDGGGEIVLIGVGHEEKTKVWGTKSEESPVKGFRGGCKAERQPMPSSETSRRTGRCPPPP